MKTKDQSPEKTRYSDEELQEFKELILSKIAKAEKDLEMLQQAVAGSENDVSDTSPTFKTLEEGSNVLLSPACASFDMFDDYEARGRIFKGIVNALESRRG